MTLLRGHAILDSSPTLSTEVGSARFRLTIDPNSRYTVHMETREDNGSCGETFVYQGDSITTARYVFERDIRTNSPKVNFKENYMNNKINDLNIKLADHLDQEIAIKDQLQVEWNKVFDDMGVLKEAIFQVETSRKYRWETDGEYICSWVRFDFAAFKGCKDYLREYLRDSHCIDVDFTNDALMYSMGPSIIINEDGDALDQDGEKWFIASKDYRDEETGELDVFRRNQLIEDYMEKTGCFPGVFRTDRHGNVFAVDTKAQK